MIKTSPYGSRYCVASLTSGSASPDVDVYSAHWPLKAKHVLIPAAVFAEGCCCHMQTEQRFFKLWMLLLMQTRVLM